LTVYFDSSALVAIYVTEPYSGSARREARRVPQIPFTVLHDLEVRNALRVLHGRGLLNARDVRGLAGQLDDDLKAQRLAEVRIDLFDLFRHALALSQAHASRLLCRSLDVLHVAAALDLHCTRFVSGDDRQLALARAVGLEAVDVKKVRRRRPRPRP
jgi:predicted nucleic acid-binding protein